jgi:hypothetical protein
LDPIEINIAGENMRKGEIDVEGIVLYSIEPLDYIPDENSFIVTSVAEPEPHNFPLRLEYVHIVQCTAIRTYLKKSNI